MECKENYDACQLTSPSRDILGIIANKWTVLVLHVINCEKVRYSEIQRQIPGISQKVLTGVLRRLEENGVIARTIYPVVPPKVEYEVTELGKTLLESLRVLRQWSEVNTPLILKARAKYKEKYFTTLSAK